MIKVSIVGGSGYTGGEALRLLLGHPHFEVCQVTSESNAGDLIHHTHPNLRGATKLKYSPLKDLQPVDCIFACLPHGKIQEKIDLLMENSARVVDLSADFRLHDKALYQQYYGEEHTRPELLEEFAYGIPEVNRDEIKGARHLAGAGCIATSAILSLFPLFKAGVVRDNRVFIDGKVGSSAAGASVSIASHHPERAGCLRSFKPTAHRHTAEIIEQLTADSGVPEVYLSATSTDAVRGILTTSQLFLKDKLSELEIRTIFRDAYKNEPFVRIVRENRGVYRLPEPKLLAGTNYVDIGFELEEHTGRLVVLGAIDNLVKGSAGNVIQALNIIHGWPENTGLEFTGLHPV